MDSTAFRIARGVTRIRCGGFDWIELNLDDLDRQRSDPKILSDWQCDRYMDRERTGHRDRL